CIADEEQIWLAELALTDPQAKWSVEDSATEALDEGEQGEEQEARDHLMLVGGHGQHLDRAVGVLEQAAAVIRHRQILLDCPQPLQRLEIDDRLVAWRSDPKPARALCHCHDLILTWALLGRL